MLPNKTQNTLRSAWAEPSMFAWKTHHSVILVRRRLETWPDRNFLLILQANHFKTHLNFPTLRLPFWLNMWHSGTTLVATALCTPILLCNRKKITKITFLELCHGSRVSPSVFCYGRGLVTDYTLGSVHRPLSFPVILFVWLINRITFPLGSKVLKPICQKSNHKPQPWTLCHSAHSYQYTNGIHTLTAGSRQKLFL